MSWSKLANWFSGRPVQPGARRRPAAALQVEALEGRALPAVTATIGPLNYLTVTGDGAADTIVVRETNGALSIDGVSIKVGNATKSSVPVSSVSVVRVEGGGGNDRIDTTRVRGVSSRLSGGAGDDVLLNGPRGGDLSGNDGNDTLFGGDASEFLYGGTGNDNLYGGGGDDILFGDDGLDGLYGGAGKDSLYGDSTQTLAKKFADRFLILSGETEVRDAGSADATITFRNGTKDWTPAEVQRVDTALGLLHRTRNDTKFLKLSAGGGLVFERWSGRAPGDNDGRKIRLTDLVLDGRTTWEIGYVLHEVGHNWEEESPIWAQFKKLSGWTKTNMDDLAPEYTAVTKYGETWWRKANAPMVSEYAATHPLDDFAESFAAYFLQKGGYSWYFPEDGQGAVAAKAKMDLIDGWVKTK
jgi:hypothetical protein